MGESFFNVSFYEAVHASDYACTATTPIITPQMRSLNSISCFSTMPMLQGKPGEQRDPNAPTGKTKTRSREGRGGREG